MTPQDALVELRELCEQPENGWIRAGDVLRILARVAPSLAITEAEAGILLALLDHRPLPPDALDALEAVTGRMQAIAPATAAEGDDDW